MSLDIDFSLIDAKEYDVLNIDFERPKNKHNTLLMVQAEAEYLNDLLDLQTRIKEKYEPQLIENDEVDDEEDIDDVRRECEKGLFKKGAEDLYYT